MNTKNICKCIYCGNKLSVFNFSGTYSIMGHNKNCVYSTFNLNGDIVDNDDLAIQATKLLFEGTF